MTLLRCKTCVMPNSRPDTAWVDGECSACVNYRRRPTIDWEQRERDLVALLDRHDRRVIVPSSGGKDSTAQVLKLLEYGCDITIVTARTCHLTAIGRANIDNLARYARTIEVVPNMTVRAKLNRLGLELVGDISHPEHMAIFSTPFRLAEQLGIGLVMFGENPQSHWGGPLGTEEARQMTRRWVGEFGGLLGLRPDDFVGLQGITDRDMDDYRWPSNPTSEAHFLGQYLEWSSRENARFSEAHGMRSMVPCTANWLRGENLDCSFTGIHDHMMYRKFGFGRGCQQISADVRAGRIERNDALQWVRIHDGLFPFNYAGVLLSESMGALGMDSARDLLPVLDRFTDWGLFRDGEVDGRPILEEFA